MKKTIVLMLTVLSLITGCQQGKSIDRVSEDEGRVIAHENIHKENAIIEAESEEMSEEIADLMEDQVISELHEWTAADEERLAAFKIASDKLSLEAAKQFLDREIVDTSSMMADEYVAYYENRLLDDLMTMNDLFYEGTVQEDLVTAFQYGYFSRKQLQDIDAKETIEKIDPLYDLGYKVETSEGMYYPILDYSVLYQYEDQVTKGVQDYLRLMKRQSDIMAYSDATVIVPWSELGERLIMTESLLDAHLPDGMKKRVEQEFKWGFMTFVFGTSNTPVFSYDNKEIQDPEILATFKDVTEKGDKRIKSVMKPYMALLEEENYIGTDKVYESIHQLLKEKIDF